MNLLTTGSIAIANGISISSETPEALRTINVDVGGLAGIFGGVNVAKVVATWLAFLQIHGEQGRFKPGECILEKGIRLGRCDCIDFAKGKTKKSVRRVGLKFRTDSLGQFDVLACHSGRTNSDGVCVNIAA